MNIAKKRMRLFIVLLSLTILATCAESPEETAEIAGAKDAGWVGTWRFVSIDKDRATVTHHIQASKFPNWIGTDQVRSYERRDGRLILKADIDTRGETWKFEAALERIRPAKK